MLKIQRIPYSWQTKNPPPPPIGASHGRLRKLGSEVGQEYPPTPRLELVMEHVGSLYLRLVKNTPFRIGTPYGGLRKFRSEVGQESPPLPHLHPSARIGTSYGGLRKFGSEVGHKLITCMWRLIAVSSTDTI